MSGVITATPMKGKCELKDKLRIVSYAKRDLYIKACKRNDKIFIHVQDKPDGHVTTDNLCVQFQVLDVDEVNDETVGENL